MKLRSMIVAGAVGVLSSQVALAGPPPRHASATVMAQTTPDSAVQPLSVTSEEQARYQMLEQRHPEAAQYRGGDTVVIGATTATIVLGILLLVVLI